MRFAVSIAAVFALSSTASADSDSHSNPLVTELPFSGAIKGAAGRKVNKAGRRAVSAKSTLRPADVPGRVGNPTFTVAPGWRLRPGADRGLDLQLSGSLPIRHGDPGAAGRRAQQIELQWWKQRARQQLTDQRIVAARAWLDAWRSRREAELANKRLATARALAANSTRALELRAATRGDVAAARSYLAEARVQAIDARGKLYDAEVELGAQVGLPVGTVVRAAAALPSPPLSRPATSKLKTMVEGLPAVAVARLNQRAVVARRTELRSKQSARTSLLVQVQRESPDAWIVFGGASVTLPWQARGQRALAESRADGEWAAGQLELERRRAATALVLALHEVEHTARVLKSIESQALPRAVELVDVSRRLHKAGEITTRELLLAEQRAHGVELLAVEARAAAAWAR
ncbi:MAG: TolC family protein, partial [Deltaproteobacteria bacterium]|nr:TolC family protein [Deltaproteobacteria bacterium]